MRRHKQAIGLILIGIVVTLIPIWGAGKSTYNNFIQADEIVTAQWAQVENKLQQRYDLIPNLVNTVKGLPDHEQAVIDSITDARTGYDRADTPTEKAKAIDALEQNINTLINVVHESYPQVAASDAYVALMTQLEGTENRISVERGKYNDAVSAYNKKVRSFPGVIIANHFNFKPKPYFEADTKAQKTPAVSFDE